jgi:hypothetical protein
MMNRPTSRPADSRFRGLMIIWLAQVSSLAMLFLITILLRPSSGAGDPATLAALALPALGALALSFFIRARFASRAATERRPDLVTTGHVVAFALCEACAMLGLAVRFVTGASEAIYFFLAALVGFLLLFPRRAQIEAASGDAGRTFKTTL